MAWPPRRAAGLRLAGLVASRTWRASDSALAAPGATAAEGAGACAKLESYKAGLPSRLLWVAEAVPPGFWTEDAWQPLWDSATLVFEGSQWTGLSARSFHHLIRELATLFLAAQRGRAAAELAETRSYPLATARTLLELGSRGGGACGFSLAIAFACIHGNYGVARELAREILAADWPTVLASGWPVFAWLDDLWRMEPASVRSPSAPLRAQEEAGDLDFEAGDPAHAALPRGLADALWHLDRASSGDRRRLLAAWENPRGEADGGASPAAQRRLAAALYAEAGEWLAEVLGPPEPSAARALALLVLARAAHEAKPRSLPVAAVPALSEVQRRLLDRARAALPSVASVGDAVLRSSVRLLAAMEEGRENNGITCWHNGSSRALCCDVAEDACCGAGRRLREGEFDCWSGGVTYDRCCLDLEADECLHDFLTATRSYDPVLGVGTCSKYIQQLAENLAQCVVWTLPDRRFAANFAAPLVERREARCFEVELALPAGARDAYISLKRQASPAEACEAAGCPWVRLGVCAPLACSLGDVEAHWQEFLGHPENTWCAWPKVQVREYRSASEVVKPWSEPLFLLHAQRSSGTTMKTLLLRLHRLSLVSGPQDLELAAAPMPTTAPLAPLPSLRNPLSGGPLLCKTGSPKLPADCPAGLGPMYAFMVRNPVTRYVSMFQVTQLQDARHDREDGTVGIVHLFPTADSLVEALADPARMVDAWRMMELLYKDKSLGSNVGGLPSLIQCLSNGRIAFVARSEDVNTDALAFHQLFSPRAATAAHATALHLNAGPPNRGLSSLGRSAVLALRGYLAEDYFAIALASWAGLLPPGYSASLGLERNASQPRGPPAAAAGDVNCASAGTRWLGRLLALAGQQSWWLAWARTPGDRCRVAAVPAGEAAARGLVRGLTRQRLLREAWEGRFGEIPPVRDCSAADCSGAAPPAAAVAVLAGPSGMPPPRTGAEGAEGGDPRLAARCRRQLAELAPRLCWARAQLLRRQAAEPLPEGLRAARAWAVAALRSAGEASAAAAAV